MVDISSLAGKAKVFRRRWVVIAALCVLLAAGALRFVNIGWSFSNNGIDEGVMIERSLMVHRGYTLYDEMPCDQAPLAFIVGSLFDGDVVTLRALTAFVSIVAIACCMHASRRLGGNLAMLATGALLAVDFAFVRESRLFSLDALSASFLSFSAVAFLIHLERPNLGVLALAGVLAGIACSFKLMGGLALVGILLFMVAEAVRKRISGNAALVQTAVVVLAGAIPIATLLVLLGPSDMIQGMVLDQGHREFDAFLKLSLVAYFGLSAAFILPFVFARRIWISGPRQRFLLVLSFSVLVFMLVQPLLFLHHLVFASPGLAILAGIVIARPFEVRKAGLSIEKRYDEPKTKRASAAVLSVFMASIVVSGGLSTYGLVAQDEPSQIFWGRIVGQHSSEGEYVICGDPLIAAYAKREMPPDVVNVAERQFPELTLERLSNAVMEYNVSLVLVCYYLNDFEGLPALLNSSGFVQVMLECVVPEGKAVLDLFQDGIDPVSLYVRA